MNNIRKIIERRLDKIEYEYELISGGKLKNILSGQIEAYQDCLNLIPAPRTKKEILKDFEALGYKIFKSPTMYYFETELEERKIWVHIDLKEYGISIANKPLAYQTFTMQEHKLIHELLECEGCI